MKIKNFGFTLAEVLITLGIIGVVAAMTIPTLISNTNSQRYKSQFKKTFSTLNQMVKMNQAQYDFDFAQTTASSGGTNMHSTNTNTVSAMFNNNLTGGTMTSRPSDYYPTNHTDIAALFDLMYTLSDGSVVVFSSNNIGCTLPIEHNDDQTYTKNSLGDYESCFAIIDVNGTSLPNKLVSCNNGEDFEEATSKSSCVVDNKNVGDEFPVLFHDGSVAPGTTAVRAVLENTK